MVVMPVLKPKLTTVVVGNLIGHRSSAEMCGRLSGTEGAF